MGSCCGACAEAKAEILARGGFGAWIEKSAALLRSWPLIIISLVALLASFLLIGRVCADHTAVGWHSWKQALDPAWIALFICGLPIMKEAVIALAVERRIRAALLISTAMVACVSIGQLFAAGEVAFIMALGEKLEVISVKRAKKGLHKLVSLVPETARYVVTCPKCIAKGIFFKDIKVSEIAPGDGVMVKPGETIPVDGIITQGSTSIDQSIMTGESLPVDKTVGDEVYSGTINC